MITVICGTNRIDSETSKFAKKYFDILSSKEEEVKLLELEKMPHDFFFPEMYDPANQAESLTRIQDEYFIPAEKLLFVVPEYNGGMPGALKLFLDAISVREYQRSFKGKKAALCGIASGRAGNLRGMDHLSGVLNHVGTIIMPNKFPISSIKGVFDKNDAIGEETTQLMEQFVDSLLEF